MVALLLFSVSLLLLLPVLLLLLPLHLAQCHHTQVDEIICVAVNDAFVLHAWAQATKVTTSGAPNTAGVC